MPGAVSSSRLFPEPEMIRPFPSSMPPDLAELALPLWQIDLSYRRSRSEHDFTRYPHFFSFDHAEKVLGRLLDYQTMLVLTEIRLLLRDGDNHWIYDDPAFERPWTLDRQAAARMTVLACSAYSLTGGLESIRLHDPRIDASRDRSRFELKLYDYENLMDIVPYEMFSLREQ
jgi:hypothetical protein